MGVALTAPKARVKAYNISEAAQAACRAMAQANGWGSAEDSREVRGGGL